MDKNIIKVGNKTIGGDSTFVIAEIGSNHNQDIKIAKELMHSAKEAGADAVKFQSINPLEMYHYDQLSIDEKELLNNIRLDEKWYFELFEYAKKLDIILTTCPTYLKVIPILEEYNIELYKIASPQTYGFPQIIDEVSKTNKPIIMSTGYCRYAEIERAVQRCKERDKLILLHCISTYPVNASEVNLNFIKTLRDMFGIPVGFSDHSLGYGITLAAVALGARVIEKHITFSRQAKGPDHYFALEMKEFENMVTEIRNVDLAMGRTTKQELSSSEMYYRDKYVMKLVATSDIHQGEKITSLNTKYVRDEKIKQYDIWSNGLIIGKNAKHAIPMNVQISNEDCE